MPGERRGDRGRAPRAPLRPPLVVVQNGRLQRGGSVKLSAMDPAINAGIGVFETMRVRDGRLIAQELHLDRFAHGALDIGVDPVPLLDLVRRDVALAQRSLGMDEAVVRVALTAGGAWWVRATPAPPPRGPLRASTAPGQGSILSHIKHMSRAVNAAALAAANRSALAASREPIDELMWRTPAGGLLEGTWSNVLGVQDGVLVTAPADGQLLAGITRARALAAAAVLGVPVRFAAPEPGDLDELWCCSAVQGLVPVVQLDGAVAPGAGPIGHAIADLLLRGDDGAPPR